MAKYFAYGSNCNPQIMQKKQVAFSSRQGAVLPGYRLLFNKKALRDHLPDSIGFANIHADPTGTVEGVLYEIAEQHLDRLDASERTPDHYRRVQVVVETACGTQNCWAYQAQPDKIVTGLVPTRIYLNHILTAREFFSGQYYDTLNRTPTYAE